MGQLINLAPLGDAAAGVSISVTARRDTVDGGNGVNGGDGFANVGRIDSIGAVPPDLGVVKVDGDLGHIRAGDANLSTPGVRTLKVHSLGRLGIANGSTRSP